ncbi:MAG: glycosyltransferase family 39 protein [Nitrospirae bacterium]|nr:glycosyltransferase family 39 protein [Nitrospirota bacterium]
MSLPPAVRALLIWMLGMSLRLPLLGRELNLDEIKRWQSATGPLGELWDRSIILLGGNPLYSLFLRPFSGLEPTVWIRLPGLLAGAMVAPLAYAILRKNFGERIALGSAAILACSPFQVEQGALLKEYPLALVPETLTLWFAARLVAVGGGPGLWAAIAAAETVSVWLSLPSIFVWGGLAAALPLAWHRTKKFPWGHWLCSQTPVLASGIVTALSWPHGNEAGFQQVVGRLHLDPLSLAAQELTGLAAWYPNLDVRLQDFLTAMNWADAYGHFEGIIKIVYFLAKIGLGGGVVILVLRAWTRYSDSAPLKLFAWTVGLAPFLYYIAFLARGYGHLYLPQAFLASSMGLTTLLAAGFEALSSPWKRIIGLGLGAASVLSLLTLLAGVWPHPYRPVRPLLSRLPHGTPAWIYPADAVHYIRYNAPPPRRKSIRSLGPTALERPDTWKPIFEIASRQVAREALRKLPRGEAALVAVRSYLQWSDPDLAAVDPCRWALDAQDGDVWIFKSTPPKEKCP